MSSALPAGDRDEILAAMKDVQTNGLTVARHLRGEIYEVRASGARGAYRVLFATEGAKSQVLLAVSAFAKKTQKTPPPRSDWRSVVWPIGGDEAVAGNSYLGYMVSRGKGGAMARKDDLDQLIDELAEEDSALPLRVAAALERRELARQLAERRRDAGLTQAQLAARMGTSQGQITRFESGSDTRLSTVARYAAAIEVKLHWSIQPLDRTARRGATVSRRRSTPRPSPPPQRARQSA